MGQTQSMCERGKSMKIFEWVRNRMSIIWLLVGLILAAEFGFAEPLPADKAPDGWSAESPRDEIRPAFAFDPTGGPDGKGCLSITADKREGLAGYWKKTVPVSGGKHY